MAELFQLPPATIPTHKSRSYVLQEEIVSDPARYVELDPELATAVLDIRRSGKRALLITNSDWHYTRKLMSFAYDRYLPGDMTWRDLFDMVSLDNAVNIFSSLSMQHCFAVLWAS